MLKQEREVPHINGIGYEKGEKGPVVYSREDKLGLAIAWLQDNHASAVLAIA